MNMKAGKASDMSGLAAEMLKVEFELLQLCMLDLFNDTLVHGKPPPCQVEIYAAYRDF